MLNLCNHTQLFLRSTPVKHIDHATVTKTIQWCLPTVKSMSLSFLVQTLLYLSLQVAPLPILPPHSVFHQSRRISALSTWKSFAMLQCDTGVLIISFTAMLPQSITSLDFYQSHMFSLGVLHSRELSHSFYVSTMLHKVG